MDKKYFKGARISTLIKGVKVEAIISTTVKETTTIKEGFEIKVVKSDDVSLLWKFFRVTWNPKLSFQEV